MTEISNARTILVIDDEELIQSVLDEALTDYGFKTWGASDGVEGIETYSIHEPDLVILDVRMPRMDGWETLRQIRALGKTPVIMISAFVDLDRIKKGFSWGANEFMGKPIDIMELIAKINTVIRE